MKTSSSAFLYRECALSYALIVNSRSVLLANSFFLLWKPIHEARTGPSSRLNIEYCAAVENTRGQGCNVYRFKWNKPFTLV